MTVHRLAASTTGDRISALQAARIFVERWRHILKYHRPAQLLRRAGYRLRDALPTKIPSVMPSLELRRHSAAVPGFSNERLQELIHGRVTLLNQTREISCPVDWNLLDRGNVSPLWRFHLHYHEYLLEIAGEAAGWPVVREVLSSWRRRFGSDRDRFAWHPYCISRRIPVWAALLSLPGVIESERPELVACLAQQSRWLFGRLERDIGGNHLWENARALVIAGCLFDGSEATRWLTVGRSLLEQCLREQLLPWGEHYERSPMYQWDLARGLDEAAHWIEPLDHRAATAWRATAGRMIRFLDAIRHPDGGIPLFGDSTMDVVGSGKWAEGSGRKRETANRRQRQRTRRFSGPRPLSHWVGEYYVHREGGHQLIFDAGDMGPDHLPAHAHADLLGFELSAFGRRLFVDSGVFSYSGEPRNRFRGTRAHNVCVVDEAPLADVWSSFRMGRRGHVVGRSSGRCEHGCWVVASHDAYRSIGIPVARRVWLLADGGPWHCVDVVTIEDHREHRLESLLHLAPDYSFDRLEEGRWRAGPNGVIVESIGEETIVRKSFYSDRFYRSQANECLGIRSRCSKMGFVAWCVSFAGEPCRPAYRWEGNSLEIAWSERGIRREARVPP